MITMASRFSVSQTIDRLADAVAAAGSAVFARIDHAKGAQDSGLQLRAAELLIFGQPKVGTSLMQDQQTAGIDLPIKALAWEDENGRVWLGYSDTAWPARRHCLGAASAKAVEALHAGTAELAGAAAGT
jgi:uncharacterized protein (DUF302 family)